MKITPEAVKERIAALESAGELSLKEQFYLAEMRGSLEKDKRIAELEEALGKAKATEAHCNSGWNEAHEQEARAEAAEKRIAELVGDVEKWKQESATWEAVANKQLGIVAGIKADGIREFADHLLSMDCQLEATWAKSFIAEVLNVKGR